MVNLFSRMLPKDIYDPMSETEHSELRMDEDMEDVDIESIGLPEYSSLSIDVRYKFTRNKRIPVLASGKKYGGSETFETIYEILTELNDGEPFIDTYFSTLFLPFYERIVRAQSRKLLLGIKKEHEEIMAKQKLTKSGAFDRRTTAFKKMRDFQSWKDDTITQGFDEISLDIKRHIKICLATGRIPLNFGMKEATIKRRKQRGLTPLRAFFATGQLIDNLVISYTAELTR